MAFWSSGARGQGRFPVPPVGAPTGRRALVHRPWALPSVVRRRAARERKAVTAAGVPAVRAGLGRASSAAGRG